MFRNLTNSEDWGNFMEDLASPKVISDKEPQIKEADNSADDLSSFVTIKGNADWLADRNVKPLSDAANNPEAEASASLLTIKRFIIGASIVIIFFAAINSFQQTYRPQPNAYHQNNVQHFELQCDMPPIGSEYTFTLAQIRWVLREDIRIEAMRDIVNSRNASAVDNFNSMVSNYNARVAEFRYIIQDMEYAQREIEAIRSQIVWEAVNEARRWNAQGSQ